MAALLVIVLELPRYTFATLALGLARLIRPEASRASTKRVTAIVPSYNGGRELGATLKSLLNQRHAIHEIFVVDDGSTDDTQAVVERFIRECSHVRLLRHKQRAGKSAAINHAAYLATGELLLVIDHDTKLYSTGCEHLAAAFDDPAVATASGNLLVSNRKRTPLTALQSLEYMLAIAIGRGFLNKINAISCCSGAFSMFRAEAFKAVGGMNVGPGEDLEITLRFRKAGYRVRFVDNALAETSVPENPEALFKQRLRWEGDAVSIRLFMYRELSLFKKNERLSDSLGRFDYIFLEFLPTLIFPFYLIWLWLNYGSDTVGILSALYVILFWFYTTNVLMAIIITGRRLSWIDILVLPVLPLYQGVIMRLVRFVAISDEVLLARSRYDPLVPSMVRRSLYED